MARPLHDRPYYKPLNQKILPLRWLAPETLQEIPVFAIASDVYSYGVVLYELVTFCETPYSVTLKKFFFSFNSILFSSNSQTNKH